MNMTQKSIAGSVIIPIERSYFTESSFYEKYKIKDLRYVSKFEKVLIRYKPRRKSIHKTFLNLVPIIKWLPKYRVKEELLTDIISGLTVGIIQLAPVLANSQQISLPPINGLYVAFLSSLIYVFLGTSRQLSMSTNGVICSMIDMSIRKYDGVLFIETDSIELYNNNKTMYTNTTISKGLLSNDPNEAKLIIATSLAFLTGLIQAVFSFINGGLIANYMSKILINAFTFSSAFAIFISQLHILLGINVPKPKSVSQFQVIQDIFHIYTNVSKINLVTTLISSIIIIILYTVNKFNFKYKHLMKVPIPIELIAIITIDLVSNLLNLNKNYDIQVVGKFSNSLPLPKVPNISPSLLYILIGDAASIALISFALNTTFAKYFSIKNNYNISSNQELFSYGLTNISISFIGGFPFSANYSRSLNADQIGSKFQIFSLVSSLFTFASIFGIGRLLQELPTCVLSSVIVYSLIDQCLAIKRVNKLIKNDRDEWLIWVSTCLGALILDIRWGLYIGLGISLAFIILNNLSSNISVLGNIPGTELYEDKAYCQEATEYPGTKVLRFEQSITYVNANDIINKVIKKIKQPIRKISNEISQIKEKHSKTIQKLVKKHNKNSKTVFPENIDKASIREKIKTDRLLLDELSKQEIENVQRKSSIKNVIIDLSSVNLIDSTGLDTLLQLKNLLEETGISMHLSSIKRTLLDEFIKHKFNSKFDYNYIYPSTNDAIKFISGKQSFKKSVQ